MKHGGEGISPADTATHSSHSLTSPHALPILLLMAPTVPQFPNPALAPRDGLLALGGDLKPATLAAAYAQGIFPWPMDGVPLAWFSPDPRAVLEFDRLHIPRSLEAARKRTRFTFTLDQAFAQVIAACAASPRPGQPGTWITTAMLKAYAQFHKAGHAHSVEAWEGDQLIGGLYGVDAGGVFAGESMFYLKPNASKLALLFLADHLRSRGAEWMDIQMLTPHLKSLGAREIPRQEFLRRLQLDLKKKRRLF